MKNFFKIYLTHHFFFIFTVNNARAFLNNINIYSSNSYTARYFVIIY